MPRVSRFQRFYGRPSKFNKFHRPWKCEICGMTERKEPHRKLSDHMSSAHGRIWSEERNDYIPREATPS